MLTAAQYATEDVAQCAATLLLATAQYAAEDIAQRAAGAALLTAACNTVAGIGRDAQAAGAAVAGAANDMKR